MAFADHFLRLTKICLISCSLAFQAFAGAPCQFVAPERWEAARTKWDGGCRDGFAHGLGILKELGGKDGDYFFYGRMKNGSIEFGVMDWMGGYMAGWFKNGSPVDSDDMNVRIQAFDLAEKVAREAAERFRKAGNKASEKFYLAKAKQLHMQIE